MEIYYSLDKHKTSQDNGGSVLTCLSELPHPGEVVHVAVAQQRVGAQVELGRDLEGGVGDQGGEVDSHQLVTLQSRTTNSQTTRYLSLSLSLSLSAQ